MAFGMVEGSAQRASGVAYRIIGITDSGAHGTTSGHCTHGGGLSIMPTQEYMKIITTMIITIMIMMIMMMNTTTNLLKKAIK